MKRFRVGGVGHIDRGAPVGNDCALRRRLEMATQLVRLVGGTDFAFFWNVAE